MRCFFFVGRQLAFPNLRRSTGRMPPAEADSHRPRLLLILGLSLLGVSLVTWSTLEAGASADSFWQPISPLRATFLGDLFFKSASALGHTIPAVLLLMLVWLRGWAPARSVQLSALAFVGVGVAVGVLKLAVQRGRPFDPESLAWPSGHSASAAALALVFLGRGRWSATVGILLALAIGASRVVLGRHWPADVVGGFATALLIGAAAARLPVRIPERAPRGPLLALTLAVGVWFVVRAGFDDNSWHVREAFCLWLLLLVTAALTAADDTPEQTSPLNAS